MPEVFISYARRDARDFVAALADELERRGVDVWVDLEDIPPASQWRTELTEALTASDAVAYVISPAAVTSQHCATELALAEERNKRLVPIRLELPDDPATIPGSVEAANWIPSDRAFDPAEEAHIDALVDAIRTDREWVRDHTRLSVQASEWEARDQDRALLLRGSELGAAEDWLDRAAGKEPEPTEAQRLFVSASRRSGRRRTRTLLIALAVGLVVTATLAVVALQQRAAAQDRADRARAGELASEAETVASSDPELALILARTATEVDPSSDQAEQELRTALGSSFVRARIDLISPSAIAAGPDPGDPVAIATGDGVVLWDAESSDSGELVFETERPVTAVAYNDDASAIAIGDDHGTIRIFGLEDGSQRSWRASSEAIRAVEFSPKGQLASGGDDGNAQIWSADSAELLLTIDDPGEVVHDVSWSPTGARLVTTDEIGRATVWNARNGSQEAQFQHKAVIDVSAAEFSPDGRTVLSAGSDVAARLWDARTGAPISAFATFATAASDADFALGSDLVLVSSVDGRTIVYERRHRRALLQLSGHRGPVIAMAVLPGSRRLVTVGADGSVRAWELLEETATRFPLVGPGQVAITPDRTEAVYAAGNELRGSDLGGEAAGAGRVLATFADPIGRVAMSSDGSLVAVSTQHPGTDASEISVLQREDGRVLSRSSLPASAVVQRLAFADEQLLFVMTPEIAATVDPRTGDLGAGTRAREGEEFLDGEPRPDGTAFAVASSSSVREFSAETGEQLSEHATSTRVNGIAYSPSGRNLAAAADDGTVQLYEAGSNDSGRTVIEHAAPAADVDFSSDGRYVASTGLDQRIRLYDLSAGRTVGMLADVGGFSLQLDFAPRAYDLLSAGDQTLLRPCDICGLDLGGLQALADQRITREPTAEERENYALDD